MEDEDALRDGRSVCRFLGVPLPERPQQAGVHVAPRHLQRVGELHPESYQGIACLPVSAGQYDERSYAASSFRQPSEEKRSHVQKLEQPENAQHYAVKDALEYQAAAADFPQKQDTCSKVLQ